MLPLTMSSLFKEAWSRTRRVWLLVWAYFLMAALVSLFILAILRLTLPDQVALSLQHSLYQPLYLLALVVFVPFVCFAIKTVMEREANRPHQFGYIYAGLSHMLPAFYCGWLTAMVFFALHCVEVWGVLSFPAYHGRIILLGHLLQLLVFLLGASTVLAALARQGSVLVAIRRGLRFFAEHVGALIAAAFSVCAVFLLVLILALMLAHSGGLGALLGFSLRGVFEVFVMPYLIVMLGVLGKRVVSS